MMPTPLTGTGTTRCADSDFEIRFTPTPRRARLARLLTSHCLHSWGHPHGSEINSSVNLGIAELAANAVTHSPGPGRDVLLRLVRGDGLVRIEVSDTRGGRAPVVRAAGDGEEAGRGLVIVSALAETGGGPPGCTRQDGVGGAARGRSAGSHVTYALAQLFPVVPPVPPTLAG